MAVGIAEDIDLESLADLIERLGDIPLRRIRIRPPIGTATEADLLAASRRTGRIYELVEGTLVEKAMGLRESLLAIAIAGLLREFVIPRNLGLVSGADGTMRLLAGLVRMPDVAFISWESIPGRKVPAEPIPDLAPDLAIEVLSEGNTKAEMARKCREYFEAGVRIVWLVDPKARTVAVYREPKDFTVVDCSGNIDGGEVLPGLVLPVGSLFMELDRTG